MFSARREGERRASGPTAGIPPAQTLPAGESDGRGHPRLIDWRSADQETEAPILSQMRRREDTFRYLENNLMEVNFSGAAGADEPPTVGAPFVGLAGDQRLAAVAGGLPRRGRGKVAQSVSAELQDPGRSSLAAGFL